MQALLARAQGAPAVVRDGPARTDANRRAATDGGARAPVDWDRVAQAENVISAAESTGRWTAADRDKLRELAGTMPTEHRHRVILSLITLINDGKLAMVDGDSPL